MRAIPRQALAALALAACSKAKGPGTLAGVTTDPSAASPLPLPSVTDAGAVTYACARSVHVATNGKDGAPGTSAAPLATIARATSAARAGDCVLVHAGTYVERSTIEFREDGTAGAPIVVRSVDGRGAAVIDAGANRSGPTVLVQHDHVIIDGFEFRNTPIDTNEQVVHFDGLGKGKGVGSVLRNCKLTGGFDHLKINRTSQGVTVEHNELYGKFGHIPVSLTSAPGLVFRGNFGHDWSTGDDGAIQVKGGSHDVVFEKNWFQDIASAAGTIAMGDGCDSTCDIDPEHYAAVRIRATDNVMVRVGRAFDVQGCRDCAVVANTVVDSGQHNVIFKITSAATNGTRRASVDVRIEDNLIANARGDQGDVVQVLGESGRGLRMDHNLVWNGGRPVSWGASHPAGADAHSLTADPLIRLSAAAIERLPGSPAGGFGALQSSP
ncbi:MAG: lipoprotein [Gemmatimonadetes bacterium]|nr:lipoprotein [Gemmatimonadota bacterium]